MTHQHSLACKDILKNLSDFIDGDLDQDLCAEIEAHIETCPDCQVVVNTLKKTIHLVQVDGQETHLPTDARQRLFARLDLDTYVEPDQ